MLGCYLESVWTAIFKYVEGPEKNKNKKSKACEGIFWYELLKGIEISPFFLSHACMKCPVRRRHHERYSESLAVKIGWLEQLCPLLSKSTRFVGTRGIFTHRPHPRAKRYMLYVPPCLPAGWAEIAQRPSLLMARAPFGGGVRSLSQ